MDATSALQEAITLGGPNIYVPNMGTDWNVEPIFLDRSDRTILFESGVVIAAKEGAFQGTGDSLFRAGQSIDGIRLEGYGATFRMRQSDYESASYTSSEFRMGISLFGVTNFEIVGLTIEDTGGDGIYVGGNFSGGFSENVLIQDVVIDNGYRNGISVVSAKDLLIDNVVIINTGGTAPQAGIDIEPNSPAQFVENVVIRDSIIMANNGSGVLFAVNDAFQTQPGSVTGTLENVTVVSNGLLGSGLRMIKGALHDWTIKDSLVVDNTREGFFVTGGDGTTPHAIEHSALFGNGAGNGADDLVGQATLGTGSRTDTAPVFVSTDPDHPLFMFLDPSTSTDISLGASDGSFMGARGVAGDFDADANINGSDFLAWQRGESPNLGSAGDLAAWETYFGETGAPLAASVATVPEPSSIGLLLVAAALLGSLARPQRP